MTARYRRVPQVDQAEEEVKKHRADRIERISAKLHAILWIIVGCATLYFTDTFHLINSDRINRLVESLLSLLYNAIPSIINYIFRRKFLLVCVFDNMAASFQKNKCTLGNLLSKGDLCINSPSCFVHYKFNDLFLASMGTSLTSVCITCVDGIYFFITFCSMALLTYLENEFNLK
eukprot:gene5799-8003_t